MSWEGAVRAETEIALHCLFSSKSAGKNWESKTWGNAVAKEFSRMTGNETNAKESGIYC